MKTYVHIFTAIAFFVRCLLLMSCSDPATETAKDKALQLLASGTWQISTVTFDDVDETSSFSGMTLNFKKGSYTSFQGGKVWPSSGLWEFTDDNATAFVREDDVLVTIKTLSQTSLQLTLHADKSIFNGGRVKSISGEYVFVFGR